MRYLIPCTLLLLYSGLSFAAGNSGKVMFYASDTTAWTVTCSGGYNGTINVSYGSGSGYWVSGSQVTCVAVGVENSSQTATIVTYMDGLEVDSTTVTPSGMYVEACPYSYDDTYASYNYYLGLDEDDFTTSGDGVALQWVSTVDYGLLQGQRIAAALAARVGRIWDDNSFSYVGMYTPSSQTFAISANNIDISMNDNSDADDGDWGASSCTAYY